MKSDVVIYSLDVCSLFKTVNEKRLMLYPVLVYLISQAFNHKDKRFHTCYHTLDAQWDWCPYQDDFEAFYHLYVRRYFEKKYSPMSACPDNVIRISFLDNFSDLCERPSIILGKLEDTNTFQKSLEISFQHIENSEVYFDCLQKLCEKFF